MAQRFDFTPAARNELLHYHERMVQRSVEAADRWVDGLFAQIETILDSPRRCPIAPEGSDIGEEVRELLYGRRPNQVFRILYLVEEDVIRILTIRHAAQRQRPL